MFRFSAALLSIFRYLQPAGAILPNNVSIVFFTIANIYVKHSSLRCNKCKDRCISKQCSKQLAPSQILMSNIVHLDAINAKTGVSANSVVCCNSKHAN